ncbi:hypothetical protein BDF14DRAFT_1828384 [Spinellus fusiger]|nr:hypothetical protein BDF14DRAFT_1828384 [Spinellus fusiger]
MSYTIPEILVAFHPQSCSDEPPQQKNTDHSLESTALSSTSTHFTYPPYLNFTLYSEIYSEQNNYQQTKNNSLKNLNSTLGRSYRDTEESDLNQLDLRLPLTWSSKDKSRNLEISGKGKAVYYTGPGKKDSHAGSIRASFPISIQCGIYYFEVDIISRGEDGYIGIGFSGAHTQLDRLPGWDKGSWGYHGDDGNAFSGSGTGVFFGPRFTSGDKIGCGINFASNSIFYTKNGTFLGTAFNDVDTSLPLYPCVGLRTQGEHIATNFGESPFEFDISHYILEQKSKGWKELSNHSLETQKGTPETTPDETIHKAQQEKRKEKQLLDRLILSYLINRGHMKTTKALMKEIVLNEENVSDIDSMDNDSKRIAEQFAPNIKDMEQRHTVVAAFLTGNVDLAIDLAQQMFQGLLMPEDPDCILFDLKCYKFINMMEKYSQNVKAIKHEGLDKDMEQLERIISPLAISSEDALTSVENQHPLGTLRIPAKRTNNGSTLDHCVNHNKILEKEISSNDTSDITQVMMENIMSYGKELQNEYGGTCSSSAKAKARMVEIFSLLAYSDPFSSPMAHLMTPDNRRGIAEKLNNAILAYQKHPTLSPIERVYQQAIVTNKELAYHGNGKAILLNVSEHCTSTSSIVSVSED